MARKKSFTNRLRFSILRFIVTTFAQFRNHYRTCESPAAPYKENGQAGRLIGRSDRRTATFLNGRCLRLRSSVSLYTTLTRPALIILVYLTYTLVAGRAYYDDDDEAVDQVYKLQQLAIENIGAKRNLCSSEIDGGFQCSAAKKKSELKGAWDLYLPWLIRVDSLSNLQGVHFTMCSVCVWLDPNKPANA